MSAAGPPPHNSVPPKIRGGGAEEGALRQTKNKWRTWSGGGPEPTASPMTSRRLPSSKVTVVRLKALPKEKGLLEGGAVALLAEGHGVIPGPLRRLAPRTQSAPAPSSSSPRTSAETIS